MSCKLVGQHDSFLRDKLDHDQHFRIAESVVERLIPKLYHFLQLDYVIFAFNVDFLQSDFGGSDFHRGNSG